MAAPGYDDIVLNLLKHLPMTAVVCSALDGSIVWFNERDMNRIAGATDPRHLKGRSLFEFIDPSQQAIAIRDVEAVARGESPPPVTYRIRRLDGTRGAVQVSSMPIMYRDAPAILSLLADVSDRENALRELAESEERYRMLVETSPNGLVVVSGDEIVYANTALVRALRTTPEDVIGSRMYRFVARAEHATVREGRRALHASGDPAVAQPVTLVRADGDELPVTSWSALVHWSGDEATQTIFTGLTD